MPNDHDKEYWCYLARCDACGAVNKITANADVTPDNPRRPFTLVCKNRFCLALIPITSDMVQKCAVPLTWPSVGETAAAGEFLGEFVPAKSGMNVGNVRHRRGFPRRSDVRRFLAYSCSRSRRFSMLRGATGLRHRLLRRLSPVSVTRSGQTDPKSSAFTRSATLAYLRFSSPPTGRRIRIPKLVCNRKLVTSSPRNVAASTRSVRSGDT